jgi:flagellar basal body-associated protein FliL
MQKRPPLKSLFSIGYNITTCFIVPKVSFMAQKLLIFKNILLFFNILGLSGIGYFTWTQLQKGQNQIAPEILVNEFFENWDEKRGNKKKDPPEKIVKGISLPLEVFVANLAEVDETSYHITFYPVLIFDIESNITESAFAPHIPIVRDKILDIINTKTKDEVLAIGGKAKLKSELRAALNILDLPYLVKEIFFTELIVR